MSESVADLEAEHQPGALIRRAGRIATVMARHGVRDMFSGDLGSADAETQRAKAVKFRDALQELGPTFAKLGQILSTRPDLLPPAFIEELETLQEQVTPLTEEEVVRAVETELGVPWEDAFESIDATPLAAGTIAQVHRAVLEDGERVVVKIQRPQAEDEIRKDLELLSIFAEQTADKDALRRVVDIPAIITHLSDGLAKELDFTNEAANIERMREILEPFPRLGVPVVFETFTTKRLLVLEEIQGVPVRQAPEGPDRREAAKQLLESYYRQILSDGFFHADPHPGNMRWSDGRIFLFDLGMVGELDTTVRESVLLLVMALWQEDTPFVAEALLALSEHGEDFDIDAFIADLDRILKKYRHQSLQDIELGPLLTEVTTVSIRHGVRLPASLALTSKALAQMQLAAAELDPSLDPFSVAGRYLVRHIMGRVQARAAPGKMLYEMSKLQSRVGRMFAAVESIIHGARGGRLQVQFRGTENLEEMIRRAGRRLALAIGGASGITAAAIASTSARTPEWVPYATGSGGGVLLAALVWDLIRRR